MGLFSAQLLHFSPELLDFHLLVFVFEKYIAIGGLDMKINKKIA